MVGSTVGKIQTSDGSHRWIVRRIRRRLAVEKVLVAVGIPVAARWGYFISKCCRERSTGVIVAVNQFTNEI